MKIIRSTPSTANPTTPAEPSRPAATETKPANPAELVPAPSTTSTTDTKAEQDRLIAELAARGRKIAKRRGWRENWTVERLRTELGKHTQNSPDAGAGTETPEPEYSAGNRTPRNGQQEPHPGGEESTK